jgi:uncharacterized Zn-binding protein involved in type VI secretion
MLNVNTFLSDKSAEDIEIEFAAFKERLLDAIGANGLDFSREDATPWSDKDKNPQDFDIPLIGTTLELPAHEENCEPDPRPRPDFDASFEEWLAWFDSYRAEIDKKKDLEFEDDENIFDKDFDELLEAAKYMLIDYGIDQAIDYVQDLITDTLEDVLSAEPNMPDILKPQGTIGDDGGLFDKVMGVLTDFDQAIADGVKWLLNEAVPKAVSKGIEQLKSLAIDELFAFWDEDIEAPPLEQIARSMAKQIVEGLVDELLDGVKSVQDLIDNWNGFGKNLKDKIRAFFHGETPLAYLPAARVGDPDDKADMVVTGLSSVVIQGQDAARSFDLLFPSFKSIKHGSGSVLAGGLPLARMNSLTEVPSKLSDGARAVLVGGETAAMSPGGGMSCPA